MLLGVPASAWGYDMKLNGIPKSKKFELRDKSHRSIACPVCGCKKNGCIDSRSPGDGKYIRRRRVCTKGHRFTTREVVIPDFRELSDKELLDLAEEERMEKAVRSVIEALKNK